MLKPNIRFLFVLLKQIKFKAGIYKIKFPFQIPLTKVILQWIFAKHKKKLAEQQKGRHEDYEKSSFTSKHNEGIENMLNGKVWPTVRNIRKGNFSIENWQAPHKFESKHKLELGLDGIKRRNKKVFWTNTLTKADLVWTPGERWLLSFRCGISIRFHCLPARFPYEKLWLVFAARLEKILAKKRCCNRPSGMLLSCSCATER